MPPKTKGGKGAVAAPRTRNETIIIDRAKSLEQAVSEKTATLSGISRRIKQLNKDNSRLQPNLFLLLDNLFLIILNIMTKKTMMKKKKIWM